MDKLNLPEYNFNIKQINGSDYVFDKIRKKYYLLTPEEWVRQNFIEYLINEKNYPIGLIGVEQSLYLNKMKKRCDIIVYKNTMQPFIIIECKAPSVKITQETFTQVAIYNMAFNSNYIAVTNGINHYCCNINHSNNTFQFISEIPLYEK
ncbi:MAG: hypothetical protein A2X12_05680 [Bacteroidetes bacterium GWE2_29_8]|nr:MAG: hypothetical protein A2X12_05680 [Bacteroidetes bacterium GWE2_29_8]OFY23753.1 MAG: hypothetical protein A2X02_03530 [Bacteroidetes bacterium GWF2_29_10]